MLSNFLAATAVFVVSTVAQQSPLADYALQKALNQAAPVFGHYKNVQSNTSTWMKAYPDDTQIVHMNLPGTHDADTWNYSQATQDALLGITNLAGIVEIPTEYFRCQNKSLVDMLDSGIRVFDLRPALDPTNTSVVFWHSQGLVSETATMADVMYGFYKWLDDHPSEAVFLSFEYEGSTTPYGTDDAQFDLMLFDILNSTAAHYYILQVYDSFGTLGAARGKVTLLKRFDLPNLPSTYAAQLPGVHFSPNNWIDNDPNITLVYNTTLPGDTGTAYIEDYYNIAVPNGSPASLAVTWKYNATTAHLNMAATTHPDSLFWSFASSENDLGLPAETPQIMALGNGTTITGTVTAADGGVNQQLLPFIQSFPKGTRLGIVMFDFFEQPAGLVEALLALQQPNGTV
jgi:1-phosphatidylinositol phosphodiesterase